MSADCAVSEASATRNLQGWEAGDTDRQPSRVIVNDMMMTKTLTTRLTLQQITTTIVHHHHHHHHHHRRRHHHHHHHHHHHCRSTRHCPPAPPPSPPPHSSAFPHHHISISSLMGRFKVIRFSFSSKIIRPSSLGLLGYQWQEIHFPFISIAANHSQPKYDLRLYVIQVAPGAPIYWDK